MPKKDKTIVCPFKVGDIVKFDPSKHCKGWHQESFDRLRIHPGYIGKITKIEKGLFLYLDDRGGFHWIEFKKVKAKQKQSTRRCTPANK